MSLNIKNPEAHRLAKELAALTGESLTDAVTKAIQERLDQIQKERHAPNVSGQLLAIGRRTAPLFKEPWRSVDHGDLLYDDKGLPK